MSHSPEEIRKQVKTYMLVFASLLCLTAVTVAARQMHLRVQGTIFVALLIATIKASLVACYFMHLISEKKLIYGALLLTLVVWVGLVFVPVFQFMDMF